MIEFIKANMLSLIWVLCSVLVGLTLGGGNPFSILSGIEAAAVGGLLSAYLAFYVLNGSTDEPRRKYFIRCIPMLILAVALIVAAVMKWTIPLPIQVGMQGTGVSMFVMAAVARLRRV